MWDEVWDKVRDKVLDGCRISNRISRPTLGQNTSELLSIDNRLSDFRTTLDEPLWLWTSKANPPTNIRTVRTVRTVRAERTVRTVRTVRAERTVRRHPSRPQCQIASLMLPLKFHCLALSKFSGVGHSFGRCRHILSSFLLSVSFSFSQPMLNWGRGESQKAINAKVCEKKLCKIVSVHGPLWRALLRMFYEREILAVASESFRWLQRIQFLHSQSATKTCKLTVNTQSTLQTTKTLGKSADSTIHSC